MANAKSDVKAKKAYIERLEAKEFVNARIAAWAAHVRA